MRTQAAPTQLLPERPWQALFVSLLLGLLAGSFALGTGYGHSVPVTTNGLQDQGIATGWMHWWLRVEPLLVAFAGIGTFWSVWASIRRGHITQWHFSWYVFVHVALVGGLMMFAASAFWAAGFSVGDPDFPPVCLAAAATAQCMGLSALGGISWGVGKFVQTFVRLPGQPKADRTGSHPVSDDQIRTR